MFALQPDNSVHKVGREGGGGRRGEDDTVCDTVWCCAVLM